MAAETQQVEILVTANTQQARTELDKLKGSTDQASTALQKQGDAAGKGTQTLVNFNRVVQDAPYGLMGIANNIDPLVTSFNALRTETGSVGGALKLLGSSLMGPAGFISIISIATSAFIAFKQGAEKAKKPVDELKKSIDKFIEVKNPFEDIIFKFDPKNLDAAIKQVQYKLGTLKNQVNTVKGGPTSEQLADPNFNGGKYAAQMFTTQKDLLPKIAIYEKLLTSLQGMRKELGIEMDVLKLMSEVLQGASVKTDKDPKLSSSGGSSPGETAVKNIRESVENLLKLSEIQGNVVSRTQYLDYYKQLSTYMKGLGKDTDEYIRTLELADKMFYRSGAFDNPIDFFSSKTGANNTPVEGAREYQRIIAKLKDEIKTLDENSAKYKETIRDIAEIEQKIMPSSQINTKIGGELKLYEIDPELKRKMNWAIYHGEQEVKKIDAEGLKELKDNAKKQYQVYKDYFIDPFTNAFRGEFSKAWNSIFGEATSLFEKFMQGVAEQLFNFTVQKAAFGLLGMIPGVGPILELAGAGKPVVNQIIMDGELIATQKQATRTKAILDRTAALR